MCQGSEVEIDWDRAFAEPVSLLGSGMKCTEMRGSFACDGVSASQMAK